jgi:PAS domain S-box-containing protein
LLALALACPAASQSTRPGPALRLLILNSYDEAYPWTRGIVDTLNSNLSAEFPGLAIAVEYMDMRRFTGPAHVSAFRDFLSRKYGSLRFDAIVATDDAALLFLIGQGPAFLGGPPVVFGGVSNPEVIDSVDRSRFTGVREQFAFSSLVSLVLGMQPETRRIAVVLDNSENAATFEAGFGQAITASRLASAEFIYGSRLGLDGVLHQLRNLPKGTAVITMDYIVDRDGTNLPHWETMGRIAAASVAPVFSPNVSKLGQGVLCGNVNGARRHAAGIAGLAAKVLRGAKPADLPVLSEGTFGPVADYAVLQRWNIPLSAVPESVEIVNRPVSAMAPYRSWLVGLVTFLIVQSAIIALLVFNVLARRKAVAQRDAHARELERRNRDLDNLNRSILSEYAARESVEKALRESEGRYREMVENALDGIYTHDLRGRFTAVNKTLCELLGYCREELIGTDIGNVLSPESLERAREMTARKLAGEQTPHYELAVLTKSGRLIWVEVSSRLMWAKGFPSGVEGIARDITNRKSLEEELRQARQMEALGRLSGGVAHDFNNILTVVTGYSDLLLLTLPQGDPARPKVEEIRRAGERASELTRKLLAFGRAQASTNRSGDVNRTLAECAEMLRYLIPQPVEIVLKPDPSPAPVHCDPTELQQVLLNLSLNARDAMPSGGRLEIATYLTDGQVELSVSDTGHGMDETTRARAFDPFFTTKEPGRGTGLGLSTVYGIVRRAGGRVDIESSPGSGSVFRVRLPLAASPEAVPVPVEQPVTPAGNGELIFLVEDQEDVGVYAKEVLIQLGYSPQVFVSAEAALEELDSRVRLLITDVVMPGITGPDLVRQARLGLPNLHVLFISGYPGPDQETPLDGMFLPKPFTPTQLAAAVRAALTPS